MRMDLRRAGPGLVCGQPSKRRKSGSPSASHDGFPAVAFLQPWQPRRAKPAAAATASGYDAGARTQRYWLTPPGFGETVASNLITTSLPSAGSHASSALDSTKLRCWRCWCFSGGWMSSFPVGRGMTPPWVGVHRAYSSQNGRTSIVPYEKPLGRLDSSGGHRDVRGAGSAGSDGLRTDAMLCSIAHQNGPVDPLRVGTCSI